MRARSTVITERLGCAILTAAQLWWANLSIAGYVEDDTDTMIPITLGTGYPNAAPSYANASYPASQPPSINLPRLSQLDGQDDDDEEGESLGSSLVCNPLHASTACLNSCRIQRKRSRQHQNI
jgi:hypothetical protein